MLAAFGERLMAMDRRSFVRGAGLSVDALASAMATKADAQVRAVDLTIDSNEKLATMPQDSLGLSYESAQLADPAFFSASNTTLIRALRDLSPLGVLRLGGNLSYVTLWKGSAANTLRRKKQRRCEASMNGMTEGNSCYHGGQPGVSDAFASAPWAADYSLRVAQAGYGGVNLHGGGEGYYAPITGEPNTTNCGHSTTGCCWRSALPEQPSLAHRWVALRAM
jgi:hypothetical protein